jgi:sterol desaturase/sphingolipid hydroxylase (fatty acid hydroxylase superfamily)
MAAQTYRDLYVLLYAVARLSMWLAIFVPIERLFALHSQKIFRKEIAVDLGYYFLNGLLPGLVLGPPISVAVLAIHHFIPGGVVGAIAAWPIWLKAWATMLVGETAYYWAHRLSHRFRSSGGFTPCITARSSSIFWLTRPCIPSTWCGRG